LPLFPPAEGRQPPNYFVPVPGVCSTLSQNFTPIAPSCVEISSTVQTNKQTKTKSKLNITPNATLRYAVWRDKKQEAELTQIGWRRGALLRVIEYFAVTQIITQCHSK